MPPAIPVDLYLDNLDLSRLERTRLEDDFPDLLVINAETWPYPDEDE